VEFRNSAPLKNFNDINFILESFLAMFISSLSLLFFLCVSTTAASITKDWANFRVTGKHTCSEWSGEHNNTESEEVTKVNVALVPLAVMDHMHYDTINVVLGALFLG